MEFLEHHQLMMMIEIKVLVVVEENLLLHSNVSKLVMLKVVDKFDDENKDPMTRQ